MHFFVIKPGARLVSWNCFCPWSGYVCVSAPPQGYKSRDIEAVQPVEQVCCI